MYVIFDMDGVLVDTVELTWQAYNDVLAEYGVRVDTAQLHHWVGRTLADQVAELNRQYRLRLDVAVFDAQTRPVKHRLMQHLVPKPGVVRLLEALTNLGIRMAVGTSTARDEARLRLTTAGLDRYFAVMVFEEDVEHHKPDPEVYELCARRLGAKPHECVVIEDAPSGVEAARRAGMSCVAVRTPYSPEGFAADLSVDGLGAVTPRRLADLVAPKR